MPHQKNQEQEILDTQQDTEPQAHGEQRLEQTESTGTTEQLGQPCNVALVDADQVASIWEEVYPLLEKAQVYAAGELDTQDFFKMIENGDMQLWIAEDDNGIFAMMLTEFVKYPRKKVMRIVSIGGEGMNRWMRYFPALEAAALSVGCTGFEIFGRKGWLKILKDWKCSYHVLTKDIKHRLQ